MSKDYPLVTGPVHCSLRASFTSVCSHIDDHYSPFTIASITFAGTWSGIKALQILSPVISNVYVKACRIQSQFLISMLIYYFKNSAHFTRTLVTFTNNLKLNLVIKFSIYQQHTMESLKLCYN